jgi:hypothetical protein
MTVASVSSLGDDDFHTPFLLLAIRRGVVGDRP